MDAHRERVGKLRHQIDLNVLFHICCQINRDRPASRLEGSNMFGLEMVLDHMPEGCGGSMPLGTDR